jgi:hypothetical protein
MTKAIISFLSSAADDSFTSKDDEKLDCSDVHSPSESSSQDEFDKSYLDLPCETVLPIERNPDFINIGARLDMAKTLILTLVMTVKMMICMGLHLTSVLLLMDSTVHFYSQEWKQWFFRPTPI